jgi:putative transcriptional regulator
MSPARIAFWIAAAICVAWPALPTLAQQEPGRAFLLVAKPGMLDPNFSETVVLIVREDEGGPLGVILNRPTPTRLRELYPDRPELARRDDLVFFGGPVQPDALLFAFRSTQAPSKGLHVIDNIYISGFSAVLNDLLQHPESAHEQRFYAGYSGWATGQLEAEIAQGGWYVLPLDVKAIFELNPLDMYRHFLERASVPRIEARTRARFAPAQHHV